MGTIRFVLWTGLAVGLGIFLASYQVAGRTPVQHAQRAMRAAPVQKVTRQVREAVEDTADKVTSRDGSPKERHSEADRAEVEALIAGRGKKR